MGRRRPVAAAQPGEPGSDRRRTISKLLGHDRPSEAGRFDGRSGSRPGSNCQATRRGISRGLFQAFQRRNRAICAYRDGTALSEQACNSLYGGGIAVSHWLRKCSESVAGPRHHAGKGIRRPGGAGSESRSTNEPAPGREPSFGHRRGGGGGFFFVGGGLKNFWFYFSLFHCPPNGGGGERRGGFFFLL